MDDGRLGHGRSREAAKVGDLVICIDEVRLDHASHQRRFVGLVLDKSISVYKIKIVDSGEIIYWPQSATYLWKETQ